MGQPREPGFCFCSLPLALGQRSSYCAEHHARAYLKRLKVLEAESWMLR